ncbi:hypothetical protein Tco_0324277 [Tanacetum coccineum]
MMMKIMYAIVLFLVMSSVLSVSSNNNGDQEISMVVDDPVGISKAKPVEIGKFRLEDGKVFTLARKSAPSRNCVEKGQKCGIFDWDWIICCGTYQCVGRPFSGILSKILTLEVQASTQQEVLRKHKQTLPTQEANPLDYRTIGPRLDRPRKTALKYQEKGEQYLFLTKQKYLFSNNRSYKLKDTVDLSAGTQLVYTFPDMILSVNDFHNHVEVAIQTHGYDTWQGGESNLLITMALTGSNDSSKKKPLNKVRPDQTIQNDRSKGQVRTGQHLVNIRENGLLSSGYDATIQIHNPIRRSCTENWLGREDDILAVEGTPWKKEKNLSQNQQEFLDDQIAYHSGMKNCHTKARNQGFRMGIPTISLKRKRGQTISVVTIKKNVKFSMEAYGEYHQLTSDTSTTGHETESGVMLVLPSDPGLWSEVISRWESITINRLNNQTWSDNKAKLAFVENLLGEINVKRKQPQKLEEEKDSTATMNVKLLKETFERKDQIKCNNMIRDSSQDALKIIDQLRIEKERLEELRIEKTKLEEQKDEEIRELKAQLQKKKEEEEVQFSKEEFPPLRTTFMLAKTLR